LNILLWQEAVIFKFTNVVCESHNKSWAVVNYCRLRAINRNKTVFNLNVTLPNQLRNFSVDVQLFKRANGYKPWLLTMTVNVCRFTKKSYNPAAILIYRQFRDFSNINHTCPYEVSFIIRMNNYSIICRNCVWFQGDLILKGFYLRHELLGLILPTGDYLLTMTWISDNKEQLNTNVYFSFV
ncbi:hypothetical protein KR044_003153, partial [Drosophila immigrans]